MNEWMDCKEREISILKSYTNMMKNTEIVPCENDFHEEILKAEHAVCFVFTSLGSDEPYLSTLSNYLQQTPDDAQDPHPPDQWYNSRKKGKQCGRKQSSSANKENKNITFLTVGLTNETQKGASIYLYTDGFSANENFEPPSKPATVTGSDINHNSVTLNISPPRFGAEDISSYSVEYCVSGEDDWKQETASKVEEVPVSGLSPNTEYMFRCRAETPVGAGPANEVSGSIKTLPCRDEEDDQKLWKMRAKSMENIYVDFNKTTTKSLTKEVLRERKQLEISIENLQKQVKVGLAKLSPNTEYMFRCRAETPVGAGPANEVSGSIKTLPCSPPGKLHVESSSREISVSWEKPAELGQDVHVLSYIVEYAKPDQQVKEEDLHWEQMMARAEKAIISGLQPETEYAVRVRCDCGAAGRSKESIAVNVGTTKRDRLKESLKSKSKRINSESPSVYKLPLTEEDMEVDGCRRYNFGKENVTKNRTIMLLGATGSGKSTLINGLINYIVGVEWEDDFRFKLVDEDQSRSQAESQTSEVTVYKINHKEGFKIPFSLTIVDTPGFGDTRGIHRDKEITEQIRNLFSSKHGVSEIDAVCFVAQASLARLTATQKYVFESVLSIFGNDVTENLQVLVTFADGQHPPVLEAINASGVPCPKTEDGLPVHFKFNNSALFAQNQSSAAADSSGVEEKGSFDQMFWQMGAQSMKTFFVASDKLTTKSLTLTKEVLRERKQLQISIENVQKQVKVGLAKLETIKETTEKVKLHEAECSRNEKFEIEVV
ncbi:hypothetical protein F7725_010894 [Dissostichus mawsoni]|uniref:Fibronectin type-III domain-containing protein n=1 Tax=Dissostichus mawsoni TaxID=36200 RepID=A0A7J5Z835_DISMA|nr:hypothetical protein F7725_010894 [Dissostichus mawsoni]